MEGLRRSHNRIFCQRSPQKQTFAVDANNRMDSLDRVEFVMELEREFGVDVSDGDAANPTLGDIWHALRRLQGAQVAEGTPPPVADTTWRRLAQFAARRTGVPVDDVQWTDRPFGDSPGGSRPADS